MTSIRISIPWCILLAFNSVSANAHHNSGAVFDLETEVTIAGVVTKYEFRNPHVYVYVNAKNGEGEVVNWRIEAGPLGILRRLGWNRNMLAVGDAISIIGNPARNPEKHAAFLKSGQANDIELPPFRGEESFKTLATYEATTEGRADGLNGTWVTMIDLANAAVVEEPENLSLTAKGAAALESFDENTMHTGLDCIPMTAPALMLIPDTKSIKIGDDFISIRADFDNAERLIRMTEISHDGDHATIQGNSVGHWEDQVLVIETDRFADHRMGNSFGLPSGSQKHLVERLEVNPDGKSLTYQFELQDPEFLTDSVSGKVQWAYRPDVEYRGVECDPENSRRFLDEQ